MESPWEESVKVQGYAIKVIFGYEVYRKSADAQEMRDPQVVFVSGSLFVVGLLEY